MLKIEKSWEKILNNEFKKDYICNLKSFLLKESKNKVIYPKGNNIFKAFSLAPFPLVKVVIIGQDPYHQTGQANGLCFSVDNKIKIPPSLLNIFKELKRDLDIPIPSHGNLSSWAKQGILLLNSVLTVEHGLPNSHKDKGWEKLTNYVIKSLDSIKNHPVIFVLWGANARKKKQLIKNKHHVILETSHPSPFSVNMGFAGCGHFSLVNNYLEKFDMKKINWKI